jgi:hypothetical protein
MKIIQNITSNPYAQVSLLVATFGGLLADSIYGKQGFEHTTIIATLFMLYAFYDEWKTHRIYGHDILPVPIVISVDDDKSTEVIFNSIVEEIEKDKRYKGLKNNLEKYFNISSDMLTFKFDGDVYEEERIKSFFQIIKYQLNEINKRVGHRVQFHIAYLRRPGVGFVVGGMFRADGIVVYQNNDHTGGFDKVATVNTRQYKEKIKSYEKFDIDRSEAHKDKSDDNLLILLQLSSHNISESNESLKKFTNKIRIISKGNGTIGFNEDWVRYAQEIYNVINGCKEEYKKITIVHSMPEAIAVLVGMALENYWDIDIYQYNAGQYKKIINLQNIVYTFKNC